MCLETLYPPIPLPASLVFHKQKRVLCEPANTSKTVHYVKSDTCSFTGFLMCFNVLNPASSTCFMFKGYKLLLKSMSSSVHLIKLLLSVARWVLVKTSSLNTASPSLFSLCFLPLLLCISEKLSSDQLAGCCCVPVARTPH